MECGPDTLSTDGVTWTCTCGATGPIKDEEE